ncbi:MAG: AGE family epimerase/isomerase [Brevundimonas sp.]|uniref:AGE family epimerase/isomerase n=1 Tax=Brevundimonas sp. TaxID=1871086 RepID=UPI00403454C3
MTTPVYTRLRDWLFQDAFPLWAEVGLDRANGGFIERLNPDGTVIDDPRRARLVARQIYVFAMAETLGWNGPARPIVRHGLDFLLDRILIGDAVVPLWTPSDHTPRTGFDLYDQAFVLFGLAAAAGVGERTEELAERARGVRRRMIEGWKHPVAGFEEASPRTLPLKANPHMHMLEAALAWSAVSDPDGGWAALADEIVELCLSRFLSPETGALSEFFDGDWNRIDGEGLGVVEPGHQSEWAWLLIRWGLSRGRPDAIAAARRLIEVAEGPGVSDQNLAVNALSPALEVRDARHRLWPQTERTKAAVALGWLAQTPEEAARAEQAVETAASGLMRFFDHPVRGAWWEHLGPDGAPAPEPTRASSLYHITCAAVEMSGLDGASRAARSPV